MCKGIWEIQSVSCSLGVVFLSVADTADVGVELKSSYPDDNDARLAEQLHSEAVKAQVIQDSHLAEQLQLKENSYLSPRCVIQS